MLELEVNDNMGDNGRLATTQTKSKRRKSLYYIHLVFINTSIDAYSPPDFDPSADEADVARDITLKGHSDPLTRSYIPQTRTVDKALAKKPSAPAMGSDDVRSIVHRMIAVADREGCE